MKRFVFPVLFAFLLGGCAPAPMGHYRYADSTRNVNHLQRSVVAMINFTSAGELRAPTCTAFFITPRRLATAMHCVTPTPPVIRIEIAPGLVLIIESVVDTSTILGREILVVTRDESSVLSEAGLTRDHQMITHTHVIAVDEANDIAIMELADDEASSDDWLPLAVDVRIGESVYALGMPSGNFWLLSQGMISNMTINEDGAVRIIHQNMVGPGSSGSPVINERGEVVGITIQYQPTVAGLAVASPLEALRALFREGVQPGARASMMPLVIPGEEPAPAEEPTDPPPDESVEPSCTHDFCPLVY